MILSCQLRVLHARQWSSLKRRCLRFCTGYRQIVVVFTLVVTLVCLRDGISTSVEEWREGSIRRRISKNEGFLDSKVSCVAADLRRTAPSRREKYMTRNQPVVIIYATKRSGSTLLGEYFNQNRDFFYLFEPLFPFTRSCSTLRKERVDFLEDLIHCNFSGSTNKYKYALYRTNHSDDNAKCISNNLCFSNRDKYLLYRYAATCKAANQSVDFNKMTRFVADSPCGYPLNLNILSSICSAAGFLAFKIIRLCSIADAMALLSYSNVHIIHLVRDPRGVIASRLKLGSDELNAKDLEIAAEGLCGEMNQSLHYARKVSHKAEDGLSRYLRLRYEDIAMNPLRSGYTIYKFLGINFPTSVKLWITRSFLFGSENIGKGSTDPYSTVKRVNESINSWRRRLAFKQTVLIQSICSSVMKKLHYKVIESYEDQINWNISVT